MTVPSLANANYATGTGASVSSISWSHTLLSGDFKKVIVVFNYENSASVALSSMTYGGTAMHIAASHRESDTYGQLVAIGYLDHNEVSEGANTVYCSVNNGGNMNGVAFLVTGAKQGPIINPLDIGAQDLTQIQGVLNVVCDEVRMIDAVNVGATRTFTPLASQSLIQSMEHTYFSARVGTRSGLSAVGLSTGYSVSSSVNRLAYCAVAIEPARAGGMAQFGGI